MRSEGNHLYFDGKSGNDPLPATAALHNLIHRQGYQDITLDFRSATFLAPSFMLPLVSSCRAYRQEKVDFEILLPTERKTSLLIQNTNWAHLITPEQFAATAATDLKHMSARQYLTPEDHFQAVDDSMRVMLNSLEGISRSRLKALEWALNEITDNVLNHANSPIGGIVQVVTFPSRRRVEFFVCDAGVTISRSLREGRPDIGDDTSALRAAVEEGVTRNKATNQGNGLFGTFKCCEVSGGEFEILSGMVQLRHSPGSLSVTKGSIPFRGTYVRASIGYDYDKLLERALVFGGKQHDPGADFIERYYHSDGDAVIFRVASELKSFGSREAGKLARSKVETITEDYALPIEFDFSDIPLITSSFADEVFGRLFETLGAIRFSQMCRFRNVDPTIRGLIDRAIVQRMKG